jgi:predicted transcriptional regulator
MKVSQIVSALSLTVSAGSRGLDAEVTGGYSSDMLSCAMAGAAQGNLWVTLQGHLNVVAVAALNELTGVIVTEGKPVSPEALSKANDEGIPILMTRLDTFEVCGRLWELLKVEG